nr:adenylosuccinate synthetase [Stenotrophomonas sp.]
MGARLHNPELDPALTKSYSQEDTAYREFQVKLPAIGAALAKFFGVPYEPYRAERIKPLVADVPRALYEANRSGDNLLFEGAQGTLLDIDHGTYPFVTSSNCTAGGASTGTGRLPAHNTGLASARQATTALRMATGALIGEPGGARRRNEAPGCLAVAWLSPCSTRQASTLVRCKSSKAKEAIDTVCDKGRALLVIQVQVMATGQRRLLKG